MDTLVFLVKSHAPHFHYTKQLLETIDKHNRDNIPVYLAIPKEQHELYKNNLTPGNYTILFDEDIVKRPVVQSWMAQQLVKMCFSEMGLCENYFWIDGDSYFIRDFYLSDFMFDEYTPYTTIHENKDLFQWLALHPQLFDGILESYGRDRQMVMDLFGRRGKYYDWTCPNLWSVKVFDHMREHYLKPNNLTFENLLSYVPGELIWYGEYLLAAQPIRLIPCESWFKPFHTLKQMQDCKAVGNTEATLAKNFLGIVMPSKETNQLRF